MTDHLSNLAKYRLPWRRDRLAQAGALAPALRFASRNPVLLIGAAALGVASLLAWRNREKISDFAAPILEDAKARGGELVADAKAKSHDLVEEARSRASAVGEKAARLRRGAPQSKIPGVH